MKQRNVKSTAPAVLQSVDEDGVQKGTMAKLTSPDYSSNTPDLERFSPLPIFYG